MRLLAFALAVGIVSVCFAGGSEGSAGGKERVCLEGQDRVIMPSGTTSCIKKYIMSNWPCNKTTELISLGHDDEEFKVIVDEMMKTKVSHTSGNYNGFNVSKVERAINGCFFERYKTRRAQIAGETDNINEFMYFHGTPHVKEIMDVGFDVSHARSHGFLGAGLYFASYSSKCNQYVFRRRQRCPLHRRRNCFICDRQMILSRVTMGHTFKTDAPHKEPPLPPTGFHSMEALPSTGGLKYSEYAIYDSHQIYPEYVITYKIQ